MRCDHFVFKKIANVFLVTNILIHEAFTCHCALCIRLVFVNRSMLILWLCICIFTIFENINGKNLLLESRGHPKSPNSSPLHAVFLGKIWHNRMLVPLVGLAPTPTEDPGSTSGIAKLPPSKVQEMKLP